MDLNFAGSANFPKAEQVILGTLVQNRDAIVEIADILKPFHFFDPVHSADYGHLLDLWSLGGVVDVVTATHFIWRRSGEEIGSCADRINGYTLHVSGMWHLRHHVYVLIDLWKRRRISEITGKIYSTGGQDDPDELRAELHKLMQETADDSGYAEDTLANLSYQFHNSPTGEPPLKWGLEIVDDMVSVPKGTVTVLGGRPGSGKSAAAICMALNICRHVKVWYVSLEMPKDDISCRSDAMFTGINVGKLLARKGLTDADHKAIAWASQHFLEQRKNLVVNFVGHISTIDFMAQAARKVQRDGVGLIVIDYMQLMTADARQFKTEYDRVTEISRVIRRTAREYNVPILALSQLRRDGKNDGKPNMQDLRSSGQIEQDAHVILLLSRPDDEQITFSVAKNRNGITGEAGVWCDLSCGRVGGKPDGWPKPPKDEPF